MKKAVANLARSKVFRDASLAAVAASLGFWASPALAQTAASPSAADASGTEEIVVTAQKREESLQDVPISVSVLSGDVLDSRPSGGSLDALIEVPSVSSSMADAGGMTQISIRGVAPPVTFGVASTTVGYYVDGVPFALGRSAAVPNTNDFDLSRIEILRGPQGTLYGASALNGVVNITTRDADPTRFEAKARAGLATTDGGSETYGADAALNLPIIEGRLAARLSLSDEHEGGWIDQPNLGRANANSTNSTSERLKVAILPTDDLRIDLTAWHSHRRENAASFAVNGVQPNTFNRIPSTTEFTAYNAHVVYDFSFASLSSSTSYMDFEQSVFTDVENAFNGPFPDPTVAVLHSDLPAKVFTEEVLLTSQTPGNWRWQVGAFYRDAQNDTFQTLPVAFGTQNISFRDDSVSYAVFGETTRAFADDHFELTLGLRYFHDSYGTESRPNPSAFLAPVSANDTANAVTPRIVLAWLPDQNTNVYASYSEGFRSGVEQQPLALLGSPGLPPAGPDRLHNYEIGAKGRLFGNFVTYDASLFYLKWDDIQQSGQVAFCNPLCVPVGALINGTSASGFGYDLSLTFHPAPRFNVGFAVSENDLTNDSNVYPNGRGVGPNDGAVYVAGDRTAFSPQYTASAFLDYTWTLWHDLDATFQLTANYRSKELFILSPAQAAGLNGTHVRSCNGGNLCYDSDAPFIVNTRFEVANQSGQALSLYVTNLTNWDGLLIPAPLEGTEFRQRPTTIGIQFETKF